MIVPSARKRDSNHMYIVPTHNRAQEWGGDNVFKLLKMDLSLPIATEIINVTATERSMIYTNVVHIFIPAEC